jgi:hypothetical protein
LPPLLLSNDIPATACPNAMALIFSALPRTHSLSLSISPPLTPSTQHGLHKTASPKIGHGALARRGKQCANRAFVSTFHWDGKIWKAIGEWEGSLAGCEEGDEWE